MYTGGKNSKHVSHVGEGLCTLAQVPELHNDRSAVQSLNLHSNAIQVLDGLHNLVNLTSLNLSSNSIRLIENLSGLVHLTSLNLASNSISELRGLEGLCKLQQLNVSYNVITSIQGITALHGSSGSLSQLNLQHNQLPSLQALAPLAGCLHLQQLKVGGNPCTLTPAAYAALRQALPQVQQLDESEAVSLAACWQMAHAQLQAYDAGQLQQQQQQLGLVQPQHKPHQQEGASRSPKRRAHKQETQPEQECSSSSSQSSMEGVEPPEIGSASDSHQRGQEEQQHSAKGSRGKASTAAALASASKRAKPGGCACEAGMQTDDFITAAEVQLVTETQELRQQLNTLAGKAYSPLLGSSDCMIGFCR
jgi:hypothetical protein